MKPDPAQTCRKHVVFVLKHTTHDHHHPRHYQDTIIYNFQSLALKEATFSCSDIYSYKMMIAHNYYLWHFLKNTPRFFFCCQDADIYWVRVENMLETVKVMTFYPKRCLTFYKRKYNFTTLCYILDLNLTQVDLHNPISSSGLPTLHSKSAKNISQTDLEGSFINADHFCPVSCCLSVPDCSAIFFVARIAVCTFMGTFSANCPVYQEDNKK